MSGERHAEPKRAGAACGANPPSLHGALSLPDAQRDAVRHKYLEGISQDEIAALIHHGLKALRGMLEEDAIG